MVQVVWFKRDLRLADHHPLTAANRKALSQGHSLILLYIIEDAYWNLPEHSFRHLEFIRDSLMELRQKLKIKYNQNLLIMRDSAASCFVSLHNEFTISEVHSHEETGIRWTYDRDIEIEQLFCKLRIPWTQHPNGGVIRKLRSRDHWKTEQELRLVQACLKEPDVMAPPPNIKWNEELIDSFSLPILSNSTIQKGGRKEGLRIFRDFLESRSHKYQKSISKPSLARINCSRLSPHLTFGTVSIREAMQATWSQIREAKYQQDISLTRNLAAFQSRLHWHCHFIQKLEDQPPIEFRCMHSAFEGMREPHHDEDKLQRWISGKTGFPFVDACIRSLHQTGYLNFRMRAMIVSFAAYHLFLDWRKINPLLAALFTDYEPGIHLSQLQMQSGVTGINTLRIYNPIKQGIEHDPDGNFIREFVPELNHLSKEEIHQPSDKYLKPISDLKTDLAFAKSEISKVRRSFGFRNEAETVYKRLGSRKKKPKAIPKRRTSQNQQTTLMTRREVNKIKESN